MGRREANSACAEPGASPSLGLIGLATSSIAITLVFSEPQLGLDKHIYSLILFGILLAGVTQVGASVVWLYDGAPSRRATWLKKLIMYTSSAPLSVAIALSMASLLS